jgi:putative ABC transport system ATP-binding protein
MSAPASPSQAAAGGPILVVRDLYRFHEAGGDRLPVLRGISLEVGRGEFVCVMGPSGSGKSSLLHLASGLDVPSAGTVLLDGKDLSLLQPAERTLERRRTIGYVFQFFNLLPELTVRENVALPLAISGLRPEEHGARVDGLLARLGIGERAARLPHQLSGGEMQRASIARALCGGQPLILADEPTGNLSQQAGLEVMELLRACRDEDGRSVLLVTHNPRDATFADRVVFLVDGELATGVELRGPGLAVEAVHEALTALHI